MIERIFKIALRFLLLVFVQVLVLNNVRLGGYINPYLYVLFLLLLPVETPNWLLMAASFLTGLSIDLFSNTPGIHSAASVFIAFVRPSILKYMAPRDGYESDKPPSMQFLGFSWFLIYSSLIIVMHHFIIFYLEVFRLNEFLSTLLRVLLSSLLTLALILLTEFLFFKTKAQK